VGVAFRSANFSSATTNSHSQSPPAGIVDGDILLLFVGTDGVGATVTPPTGFALLGTNTFSDNSWKQLVYWKLAASESGSYVVGFSTSVFSDLDIAAYSGASGTPQYIGNTGTGTSASVSGLTMPAAGSLLVFHTASDVGVRSGSPSGGGGGTWNNRETYDTNVYQDDSASVPAGATGSVATAYASQIWIAQLVGLSPPIVQVPPAARRVVDADAEVLPPRRPRVAAVLAPAPAAPDTVLQGVWPVALEAEEIFTPRARTMIAAVLAVVATDTVLRPPPRPVDVEPEQTFRRPRPGMAPLLPPPTFIPEAPRRLWAAVDPDDLPPRRPQIAAAIAAPDTVLCPPGQGVMAEEAEYLPRARPPIAALLATAVVADTILRAPPRPALPLEDQVLSIRRPGIAAVLYAPDTILRPSRGDVLWPEDDPPAPTRTKIAAAIAAPDTVLRPGRRLELATDEAPLVRARPGIAAAIAPAPTPDAVPGGLRLHLEPWPEDLLPARRPGIAAAIAAPDTILRPFRRTVVADDDALPQRRAGIAAVLATPPAVDTILRPGRRVDLAPDEAPPVKPRPGVAALLAPAPVVDSVLVAPRPRSAWQDDEVLPGRRPAIAAVVATAPAPDYVSRAPRPRIELEAELPIPRPRPGIAGVLYAPDFIPRAPVRPALTDLEPAPDRRPRPIAALVVAPAADTVLRNQRTTVAADEDWTAPIRRPGIAAVLAPAPAAPDTVPQRPVPHVPVEELHELPPRRPLIAAVLAPPPIPAPLVVDFDFADQDQGPIRTFMTFP
jgi:hypothetical protein